MQKGGLFTLVLSRPYILEIYISFTWMLDYVCGNAVTH